ncbi:MAG: hypothetical protein FJ213_02975 [Ignavibacteria bacterium]|nr:hypothetical protein [Ignavibacteria bacterium]
MRIRSLFLVALLLPTAIFLFSCQSYNLTREVSEVKKSASIDHQSEFIKIHKADGGVYVLQKWIVDEQNKTITGTGILYDHNREIQDEGYLQIPYNEILLIETNVLDPSLMTEAFGGLTLVSGALTVYCLTNPKACFGSCPTIYAWDGKDMSLQAEGFSSSIARVLEEEDIDALHSLKPQNRNLEIKVTNEALETHSIKYLNILAARRHHDSEVFHTHSNEFYEVANLQPPKICDSDNGDCLERIKSFNDLEYYSETDSSDLAVKETLELTFDQIPDGKLGLVLGYRQTLLTTYLIYQSLAYMGSKYGDWLAKLETNNSNIKDFTSKSYSLLGDLEIYILDENQKWKKCGSISENGPIARNLELASLIDSYSLPLKIQIRMTRGMWRIDYAAIGQVINKVEPQRIFPIEVSKDEVCDESALQRLHDSSKYLVTFPGDSYSLFFQLPEDYSNYEYFVESKGYYYEWMRDAWLKEESQENLFAFFFDSRNHFKKLAPEYKKIEPTMDKIFWESKYENK